MEAPGKESSWLRKAEKHPGYLALLCTPAETYLTRDYQLWCRRDGSRDPKEVRAEFRVSGLRRWFSRWPWLRRLGRLWVRELLQIDPEHLLAVVGKSLVRLRHTTGEAEVALTVTRGGRPKGLLQTPDGELFAGEYGPNPRREELRIWASGDQGRSWAVVHELPKGSAKHIHNLIWDEARQGIWVLTGDADGECAFLFTPDRFSTLTEVVRGGQLYRAVQMFCRPEGLFYGTDTERARNWWVFFQPESGRLEKIRPLPGSCIHAAEMAGHYVLSTSVEPSRVNRGRQAILWVSRDLEHWEKLLALEKDWLPGEYFGFGSIALPRVQRFCPDLVFTPMAVKGLDFTTFILPGRELAALPEGEGESHEER